MKQFVSQGVYSGEILKQQLRVICVDLAGPDSSSAILFRRIVLATFAKNIRQDHFYIQRKTNERHEVIGGRCKWLKDWWRPGKCMGLFLILWGLQGLHSHMRLETISKQLKARPRVMWPCT